MRDFFFEIAVGRGDDTDIDADIGEAADPS
jgi:hypothetical protein